MALSFNILIFFKKFCNFFLSYVYVHVPACLYVHHMSAVPVVTRREHQIELELE